MQRNGADDMLRKLGRMLAAHGRPFIVMCDWSITPDDVSAMGLPQRVQATLIAPSAYTCFS